MPVGREGEVEEGTRWLHDSVSLTPMKPKIPDADADASQNDDDGVAGQERRRR